MFPAFSFRLPSFFHPSSTPPSLLPSFPPASLLLSSCMHAGTPVVDDDDVNTSEGGTAEEHTSTTSKVIAELISSTFSELLIGINPSDQAAVDAALLSGATAEATAKEGAAAAAAAAVDGGGGASPPGEFSPEVEQQIKAENAIILATSCAALQASAFVTGAKAFVRAEVLRSPEAGPASVPQPVQSADNSVTPFLPRTCSRSLMDCSMGRGKGA